MLFQRQYTKRQWTYTWEQPHDTTGKFLVVQQMGQQWLIGASATLRSVLTTEDLDCWQHIAQQTIRPDDSTGLYTKYCSDDNTGLYTKPRHEVAYQDYWSQDTDNPGKVRWVRYANGDLILVALMPTAVALEIIEDMRQLLANNLHGSPYQQPRTDTPLSHLLLHERSAAPVSA